MDQISNLPLGVEIYTKIMSPLEAEYLIDKIENSINFSDECNCSWGEPSLHSPDITCLRRNLAINLSNHAFLNTKCVCGIREIDAMLGKIMLKCLKKYTDKYPIGFTQDEGMIVVKQGDNHMDVEGVDDNPFVNRVLSMHMPLNIDSSIEYINFPVLDFSISVSSPSIILFPSNFIYAYSKINNPGLYEVQNYLNNNPSQEYLESIFSENTTE